MAKERREGREQPRFQVSIKRRVERGLKKLPRSVQDTLVLLLNDLQTSGPIQKGWSNFSGLGPSRYHCHLSGSYVACWTHEKKSIEIEVYYVGSREEAPY
jgi:mRNA-degrading endonuclease RelE of RelBE toxin-antitoxin system